MPLNLARVRTLLLDVPRNAKLAYCLLRDDRVPPAPKAVLAGALALVVSPLDLPGWVPVIGELDMLALSVLAVKVFVEACPEPLVREHQAALKRGDSILHRDLQVLVGFAREWARGVVVGRLRRRGGAPYVEPGVLEDESA